MMKKTKLCKGCKSLLECFFNQTSLPGFDAENCPCQKCLIKGVCNTYCEEYDKHYEKQKRIVDERLRNLPPL